MAQDWLHEQFGLEGQVAVVTGGGGVLGGAIAHGLASAGARVVLIGRRQQRVDDTAASITAHGGEAIGVASDVLDPDQLATARDAITGRFGRIDILVNAAGGNVAGATLSPGDSIFNLPFEAFRQVVDLNLLGTVLPMQVFGKVMADGQRGSIINISSMTAARALTRVVGYSAAKGAVENVTRWFAMELARSYGEGMRVNAIAPGFFIGEQNRALLINEDGSLTDRGRIIVEHTPAGRFGTPDEVVGAVVWLCSPAAKFVNGIVVPIDGGFGSFSGV